MQYFFNLWFLCVVFSSSVVFFKKDRFFPMSAEAKRIRGLNFSPREVNHLFTLALQYKNILENKQTNAITNAQKNEAWVKIANEFNATSFDLNNRPIDQLKRCYENKRQAMRKKKAQVRQEVLKTGGGLPPPETKDEFDDLVLATMDPITVEGNYNQFDSDVICPILGTNSEAIEFVFENSENATQDGDNETVLEATIEKEAKISDKTNWKHYNTNDLKRPLNPAIQRGMRQANESEVNDPAVVCRQMEDQDANNKRGNDRGRGGIRGRGTPRRGPDRRRPSATIVKTMASSALAEKYEILADKKIILSDYAIKKLEREGLHAEEEHRLRKKCLELDIEIRRNQLQKLPR